MFGLLKKKLNDIVKKFSGETEDKINHEIESKEISAAEPSTESEKVADLLIEAEHEIEEMERADEREEKVEMLSGTEIEGVSENDREFAKEAEAVPDEKPSDEFSERIMEQEAQTEKTVIEPVSDIEKLKEEAEETAEELFEEKMDKQEERLEIMEEAVEKMPVSEISHEQESAKEVEELKESADNYTEQIEKKNIITEEHEFDNIPAEDELKIEESETKIPAKEHVGFLQRIFGKKETAEEEIEKAEPERKLSIVERITEKEISGEEAGKIAEELKMALVESDVALEVAEKICSQLVDDVSGKIVKRGESELLIKSSLRNSMLGILNQPGIDIIKLVEKCKSEGRPATIILLGFNGTGKTTTVSKLAKYLKESGYHPVLAAGDTFRAASIEQLEIHGQRIGVNVIKHDYGSDSAAVIFDAREHAKAKGCDVVLADTAGRSHSNANLMDELKKVVRVNKPDLKILVLDSLTGNDIVEQAQKFDEAVGVDGLVLTKADVYEKGGAALSAVHTVKKPILFLGVGQEYENLKKFDANEIVNNLLG